MSSNKLTPENAIASCPEFPYFGASYPDATCIDGKLWDLDKCDENGLYSSGDNPPCPFCNQEEFIAWNIESEAEQIQLNDWDDDKNESRISDEEANRLARIEIIQIIENIKKRYS